AEVRAIVGSSEAATAEVTIRDFAAAVSLQVIPASIPRDDNDGIRLVASVSNAQGQPVQGVAVTFQTEVGSIEPAGFVLTNSAGQAEAILEVTEAQLGQRDSFTVTASATAATGSQITDEVEVDID
ncbi:MAG TPA: Ig-like domain-containing protein, partial [Thermoanaerobaculia bacterium]|nr:Ig-like domain-containing protein [Thermoanaerobaculia bacterium]